MAITPEVRLTYVSVDEPKANQSGVLKYSVGILIPKTNKDAIDWFKRQIDAATDVLSFPMLELTPGTPPDGTGEDELDPETGLCPLGDMVISMEHVAAQAKEYGHSNRRELAYLVVHSVLHLLGYDHLDEGPQKKQMRAREEAILAELGITRED